MNFTIFLNDTKRIFGIPFAKKKHTRYTSCMAQNPFRLFTRLLILPLCAVFFSGCVGGSADPYSKRYSAEDINPNPAILNGTIIKGTDISGLHLKNVVIKNATFYNTTSTNAVFTNVVFDNCRFINAKFNKATLDNVLFRGGILTCEDSPDNIERRTQFTDSQFINTILDGVYLENAVFNGSDCSIALRNCFQIRAVDPIVTGVDIHLTLERSYFRSMTIALVSGQSTLTAANCRFEYATFGDSSFVNAVFAKNFVLGSQPYQQKKTSRRR